LSRSFYFYFVCGLLIVFWEKIMRFLRLGNTVDNQI
jgi:hypothetical protein